MKIYVKFKKPDTLKEFIHTFFTSGNIGAGVDTYNDEACTSKQCDSSRMRSFDDMLDISQTYFPETTYKDLMHELLTLDFEKSVDIGFGSLKYKLIPELSNCSTMSRLRIRYIFNLPMYRYPAQGLNKYDSKYTWYELLAMLNINDNEDYFKYINKYVKPALIHPVIDSISTFKDIKKLSNSKLRDIKPILKPITKEHIKINAFAKLQAVIKVYNNVLENNASYPNKNVYLYTYLFNTLYGNTGWVNGFNGVGFKTQQAAIDAFNKFPDIFKDLKD